MIKYILISINLVGLFFLNLFFEEPVSVTADIPSIAGLRQEFVVEVVITKGSASGFAKLQQEWPKGFEVTPIETQGASFTFTNQSAKFIWTSLPAEAEFKILYLVKIGDDAVGTKSIKGKFSYVSDNNKLSVDIPENTMTITEDETDLSAYSLEKKKGGVTTTPVAATAPTTTETTPTETVPSQPTTIETPANTETPAESQQKVATTETQTTPTPSTETTATYANVATSTTPVDVVTERKMPSEAEREFTVEVIIDKKTISGFAKLQENIPDGLVASAIESAGANFSFADGQAKFVWLNLPATETVRVVYKITVGPNLVAQKNIDGVFSYLENDETKKAFIKASPVYVNNMSSGTDAIAETPTTTNTTPATNNAAADNTATTAQETTPTASNATVPASPNGVNYKVQICAIHRNVATSYFQQTYSISETINIENHQGWVKYTVGGFNEYKSARDHREKIRNKGVVGPFVTAYNQGKRVTVQEALMITSQQWYK
ncbi:MAG: hypothetical protein J0M08_12875 [Bacteroidetes bacterium]|nr:hypothetical protein [Bacteroidota bacterium]